MTSKTISLHVPLISVVIPMHNEESGMQPLFDRLLPVLNALGEEWEIICVNDGSTDQTQEALIKYHQQEPRIKIIDFSRNFGKEVALTAGIDHAAGQAVIPIDADLQDPPELIPELIAKWREGYKVVLATRRSRPGDTWMKRESALLFYRLINRVATIKIPKNTGDFRLMDRQVVESVRHLGERTRFMKGLFAWVGYPTTTVYFDREDRQAGETSWNYWKLWKFALDGIFSFTTVPLQVWIYIGGMISLLSFGYATFLILRTLLFGVDVPGYTSLMVAVLFFGGVQLLSMGIIGEYVGRIYRETKRRPLYIVNERIGFGE